MMATSSNTVLHVEKGSEVAARNADNSCARQAAYQIMRQRASSKSMPRVGDILGQILFPNKAFSEH